MTGAEFVAGQRVGIPPADTAAPTSRDAWRKSAACRDADPDLFFPDLSHLRAKPSIAEVRAACAPALAFCAACPVCEPCGRFGWNQPGVYGGLVEPERSARRLAARRREQRRRDAKRDVA